MHFDEQRRRALELLIEKGIPAAKAEPAPLIGALVLGPAMALYIGRRRDRLGLPSRDALAS